MSSFFKINAILKLKVYIFPLPLSILIISGILIDRSDAWLTKGIAGYLTSQFRRSSFGNNEYRYQISRSLEAVHRYERDVQPVQLENPEDSKNGF